MSNEGHVAAPKDKNPKQKDKTFSETNDKALLTPPVNLSEMS